MNKFFASFIAVSSATLLTVVTVMGYGQTNQKPAFFGYLAGFENSVKAQVARFDVWDSSDLQGILGFGVPSVVAKNVAPLIVEKRTPISAPVQNTADYRKIFQNAEVHIRAGSLETTQGSIPAVLLHVRKIGAPVEEPVAATPIPSAAHDRYEKPAQVMADIKLDDFIVIDTAAPNDPYFGDQWGLSALNIQAAWDFNQGQGITIAVVDSGIELNHEDLAGNLWTNLSELSGTAGVDDDGNGYVDDIYGYDFTTCSSWDSYGYCSQTKVRDSNPNDDNTGHGTHVAGIIGALANNGKGIAGVAPQAKVMAVRALGGSEGRGSLEDVADAIRYAANMGANVINLSLGVALEDEDYSVAKALSDAVKYAQSRGCIVVASAGNGKEDVFGNTYPVDMDADKVVPATYKGVIAVGALMNSGGSVVRDNRYSNYGMSLDFMAPGSGILSLRMSVSDTRYYPYFNGDKKYTMLNGTSMATPMVSGAIALLLAQNPLQTIDDIYRRLRYSATDLGGAGFDVYNGWGMINPFKALSWDYYSTGQNKTNYLPSGEIYQFYISGNRKSYFKPSTPYTNYDYFDENFFGTKVGRISKSTNTDRTYSTFEYWTGTANKKIVTNYTASGVMTSKTEYYADGVNIYKETLADGRIIEYYQSGNRKSFYDPITRTVTVYFDEDMGGRIGRIYIVYYPNGTWTYHWYWGSTVILQKKEEFASSGALTKRTEYYPDGAVQRIYDVSTGITTEYYADLLDQSAQNQFIQHYGNAQINTVDYKVTGSLPASISFDGDGDYLAISDSDDWSFGTGNFTIDTWINFKALGTQIFMGQYQDAQNQWYVLYGGEKLQFFYRVGNVIVARYATADVWTPTAGTWHHIAIERSGSGCLMFIDGVSKPVTETTAFANLGNITGVLNVGADGQGDYFNGSLDELRISKGIARWTSNFTLQTTSYDVDAYTKLLLRESTGGISKKTLSTGEIYDYYLSGNRKSYYDPATKKKLEYYDENFQQNIGRIWKMIRSDGTYETYTYWTTTTSIQKKEEFASSGALTKRTEYYPDGAVQRIYDVSTGITTEYYADLLDQSAQNQFIQHYGNAQINTVDYKVTGSLPASISFDGDGDYLAISDSDDWSFGTGNFTIDTWINFKALGTQIFMGQYQDAQNQWYVLYGGEKLQFFYRVGNVIVARYATADVWTPTAGTWHHIAIERSGSGCLMFIDGVSKPVTETTAFANLGNITGVLNVGADGQGDYFNGSLDELRISKGIARWTSNFTLQTTSYDVDAYTKLLLRESTGGISKKTLSTGEIYDYYLSGNRKSYYDPATKKKLEYYDENFQQNIGRIWKMIRSDGTYETYTYWTTTTSIQKKEEFASSGALTKRTEYYPDGAVQRIYDVSTGITTEYYADLLDQSAQNQFIQHYGNAQINTVDYKVTGSLPASISFDGDGDYLAISDSDDWSFGTGNFTIDTWINFKALGTQIFMGQYQDAQNQWYVLYGGEKLQFFYRVGNVIVARYATADVWTPTAGTWHHIAIERSGSGCLMFIDGVSKPVTETTAFANLGNITGVLNVGADGQGDYFNGSLDELRISKGIARWTSNFTLQTTSYDVDAYTKLLLRESTGGISKKTLSTGEIYDYYLSGNRKSYYDPATKKKLEYYDENFQQNIGRIWKMIRSDGTYETYTYWTTTTSIQKKEEFASSGALTKRTEYYPDGAVQRIYDVSTGITTEYYADLLDQSAQNQFIQHYGNAQINTVDYKVTGSLPASISFDGDGDYLAISDSDDWSFGTGNFTIDTWINFKALGTQIFMGQYQDAQNQWYVLYGGEKLQFFYRVGNVIVARYATADVWTPTAGTWHHIAIERSGSGCLMFIDGVSKPVTETTAFANLGNITGVLNVGADGQGDYFNGSLDELRISKGIARWTSNFTLQTTSYDVDAYTKLLLRESTGGISKKTLSTGEIYDYYLSGNRKSYYDPATKKKLEYYDENFQQNIGRIWKMIRSDGTYETYTYWTTTTSIQKKEEFASSGALTKRTEYYPDGAVQRIYDVSTGITTEYYADLLDQSAQNQFIQHYGNAQINTVDYKVTGSLPASISFDGDGDYLAISDSDDWSFGTGNFTIDTWINFKALGTQIFMGQYQDAQNQWYVLYGGEKLQFFYRVGNVIVARYATADVWTPTAGTWHHIAIERSGSGCLMFIDGVSKPVTETTAFANLGNITGVLNVGADGQGDYFNGSLDELRISKGIARWTSNFTLQTTSYDVDAYTKLLLRESTGGISKKTLSTGEIYEYYLSGNRKSYYDPAAKKKLEYYDENISNNIGRAYKETAEDGSYVLYDTHWTGTIRAKSARFFSNTGILLKTAEYLNEDLNRINSLTYPNGLKEVYTYFGNTTSVQTRAYYSGAALLGTETFLESGPLRSRQYPDGTVRWYHPSGNLLKVVSVKPAGNFNFYQYHPSIALRRVIRTPDGTTWEYQDENFYGDKQGRLSKILSFDGSYDLYQDYWTGTDQVKTIKRFNPSGILQATYTYNQNGSLQSSVGSGTPPDFGYRSTATYYASGRIKSRTLQDGSYVEYRDENFNGDNTGRMTLLRETSGLEYRYLEYKGDNPSRGWFDPTGQVTLVERYQPGASNPLTKLRLQYRESDGRLWRISSVPQDEPAAMPSQTTGSNPINPELASRLDMTSELQEQNKTLSRSVPIGNKNAYADPAGQ